MANENIKLDEGIGSVRIADEVVSIIAGMAATEVDGIAGKSGLCQVGFHSLFS